MSRVIDVSRSHPSFMATEQAPKVITVSMNMREVEIRAYFPQTSQAAIGTAISAMRIWSRSKEDNWFLPGSWKFDAMYKWQAAGRGRAYDINGAMMSDLPPSSPRYQPSSTVVREGECRPISGIQSVS